jgi:hypothetical protein
MSLLDTASLVVTPNGTKASKLYSVVPSDGSGDLSVTRATTATRVNSSGLIESVASNVPRLDYTNGSCPSILVEPQRTNLALRSEEFNNASWFKTTTTVTSNATTAPDGLLTADKLAGTGADSSALQGVTVLASTNYVFSVYLRGDAPGTVRIAMLSSAFGTIASTNINYTTEWQRFTISALNPVANLTIYATIGGGASFGIGEEIYAWGAQLEAGSYATSYIPTTSASVTRNADVISKTGISSLIGQTEGTLFLDFIYSGGVSNHMIINDVGYSSYIYFNSQNNNELWGQIQSVGIQFSMSATAGRYKMALAYKSGSSAMYVNGTQVGTSSTTFSLSGSMNILDISLMPNDPKQKRDIYTSALWKTRLTNTQLAQLTTI